jgi:hypothetical protein
MTHERPSTRRRAGARPQYGRRPAARVSPRRRRPLAASRARSVAADLRRRPPTGPSARAIFQALAGVWLIREPQPRSPPTIRRRGPPLISGQGSLPERRGLLRPAQHGRASCGRLGQLHPGLMHLASMPATCARFSAEHPVLMEGGTHPGHCGLEVHHRASEARPPPPRGAAPGSQFVRESTHGTAGEVRTDVLVGARGIAPRRPTFRSRCGSPSPRSHSTGSRAHDSPHPPPRRTRNRP